MLLVCVLALTGTATAAGACRHDDGAAAATGMAGHAGHVMQESDAGAADVPAAGGCQCGCPCAGACSQGCQSPVPMLAGGDPDPLLAVALPAVPRGAIPHTTTHPPLRPPAASI